MKKTVKKKKARGEGMCFLLNTVFRVITFKREHARERRDLEDGARCSRELKGDITGDRRSDPLSVANITQKSLPMKERENNPDLELKK